MASRGGERGDGGDGAEGVDSAGSLSAAVVADAGTAERAREMYRRFLASDYPDALAMAEEVLRDSPDDFMARAIALECRAAIDRESAMPDTIPSPAPTPRDSEMPTSMAEIDPAVSSSLEATAAYALTTKGALTRQMCQRFLESDHPGALELAEQVLAGDPDDRMARAIADQCRAAIDGEGETTVALSARAVESE